MDQQKKFDLKKLFIPAFIFLVFIGFNTTAVASLRDPIQRTADGFQALLANAAPTVDVGSDQTITIADRALLIGIASDDNLPDPDAVMTAAWSKLSGPGTVTFGGQDDFITWATFSATGTYTLRLTVSDGAASGYDDLTVVVITAHPNTISIPGDYSTIQAGIDAAQAGDLVLVAPGTYSENLYLGKTITLASTFYTTGNENLIDQTTISSPDILTETIIVGSSTGPETKIIGFKISDGKDGIKIRGMVSVLNNHLTNLDTDAVDFASKGSGMVIDNVMEYNGDDALDVNGVGSTITAVLAEGNTMVSNDGDAIEIRLINRDTTLLPIVIRDNIMTDNIQDGIQLIDNDTIGATEALLVIERNLIANNIQAGFGLMDNSDTSEDYRAASLLERIHLFNNTFVGNNHGVTGGNNMVAVNNIFAGHTNIAVKQIDGGSALSHNLFWNNGTDNLGSNLDLGTSVFGDPLLDADYKLQPGSPAIDTGTASFTLASGETVLNIPPGDYTGAAPDIGMIESEVGGNQKPVAVNDSYDVDEDSSLSVVSPGVLSNDSDGDGDPLTAVLDTGPANGNLTLNTDGSFSYSPDANYNGPDSFTYKANDGYQNSDPATVTITVIPDSSPPQADPGGPYFGQVGVDINFDGSGSTDVDGTIVSYAWDFGDGETGSGSAPKHAYNTEDIFTVELTVTDDDGYTHTAQTTASTLENNKPVANDDQYHTPVNSPLAVTDKNIGVLSNDTDPDSEPLKAVVNTLPAHGLLDLHDDGTFVYTPDTDFFGEDTFTYVANDGHEDSAVPAVVTIRVNLPIFLPLIIR